MQRDETKEEVVSRSRMASTLLVPPSKHTLFMRGFSARQDIEKIRDFYRREAGGGECTVEFFKESENREKLFVALRFDTKDIAKDILNRFDNTEVLGDRVTISWFKDLRRARQKGSLQGQPGGFRGQWQQGNKPFHFHHKGQPFFRPRFPGQFNQRFKFIPQDGSGGENVGQRGMSPLRNGFRPGQFKKYQKGYDNVGNRGPDNWRRSSQSRHRSTSLSHSRSRSRSRSYSSRSRSRSHSRSRSRSHSHSDSRSRSRSKSRGRTHSKTPESKRRTPDRDDSRDRDHSPDTRREDREEGDKRDWDHSPDRYSERKDQSSRERSPGAVTDKYREHSADRSVSRDREKSPETSRWDRSPAREDQRSYHDNSMEESPPRRSFIRSAVKTVEQHKGDEEEYEKPEERYYEATYERPSRSRSPGGRSATVEASPVPAPPPPQDYDRLPRRREDSGRKRSLERSDEGYIESVDIGDKRRRFQEESLKDESPNRGGKGGMRVLKRGRTDQRSDDGLEDDHASHMSSPQLTTVNGVDREVDRGALGLPPDKMVLVRQKKEEIERAYRQDCETFASVVKMLISKDHELEGRMQDSLRENLKEIGQRCIQELREFIEKLKSDDVSK